MSPFREMHDDELLAVMQQTEKDRRVEKDDCIYYLMCLDAAAKAKGGDGKAKGGDSRPKGGDSISG